MLDSLRVPFFVTSLVCLLLAFLVELGSQLYMGSGDLNYPTPGLGIGYLAILDWLLLFTMLLITSPMLITNRLHARVQGIISFVVSILTLLGAIAAILTSFALLMLMVSLLMAAPFGTAIYFAKFANFKVAEAAVTLSFIMTFKVAFVIFLVLAQQQFLKMKGLVFLIATSLLVTVLLSFLHSFPPKFLAYITDDLGALITAVIAAIWSLFFLIGSIPAIIKAIG